jgi:hypothetical protein
MNSGDVLLELRAWRDEFARLHGYDVHAMAAALRALDSASDRKVVHGEPRRPVTASPPSQALLPTDDAISVPADS